MLESEIVLQRIVKGAHYIESIGKNHPNYAAAMRKYDNLCAEYDRLEGRTPCALPDVSKGN